MERLSFIVFGYRKIKVTDGSLFSAASLLLSKDVISYVNSDGTFSVREGDFARVSELFRDRIEYEATNTLGLLGLWRRTRYKAVGAVSIFIMLVFTLFISSLVWDIRVEGNERIPDSKIICDLAKAGLSVGDFWHLVDRSRVETEYLSSSRDVSWININRRGTVAYITVVEAEEGNLTDEPVAPSGYANIVATEACVIEEITVKRGVAEVKVGDVVEAGDILISGVMPEESGGGFCFAEGEVIGRVSDTVLVNVSRNYDKRTVSKERISEIRVNFFKFSLNIFKKYGNRDESCDIIEDIKTLSLSEKAKLPIEIITTYTVEYDAEEQRYSDAEIVRVAAYRLNSLVMSRLTLKDLLKIRTSGGYTEDGYEMRSDIVFLGSVGETRPFSVE